MTFIVQTFFSKINYFISKKVSSQVSRLSFSSKKLVIFFNFVSPRFVTSFFEISNFVPFVDGDCFSHSTSRKEIVFRFFGTANICSTDLESDFYSVFHRFEHAKFAYGISILSSSQFSLLSQGPLKLTLAVKIHS